MIRKKFIKNKNLKRAVLFMAVTASLMLAGCKKEEPKPIEIDRTFEYVTQETTTVQHTTEEVTQSTAEPDTTEKETQEETQKPTDKTTEKATTTEAGAAGFFHNEKSVYNTLPMFEKGKYVDHFDKIYMEGMEFSGVTREQFDEYYKQVIDAGKYTLNSKDSNRYYLKGDNMCVTLIFHEGTMLIEAGKDYWDIITYAVEETVAPTKPSETTDARYGYFDDDSNVFSHLPYVTFGTFAGYEDIENGAVMTFTDVTKDNNFDYEDALTSNGYMITGGAGDETYYVSESVIISVGYTDGTLTIKVTKNQY